MASGHASRINRPNTWLLRPGCDVQKVLANTEPSTHGTNYPMVSGAEHGSSTPVVQTSTFSAISSASSISTPRYRTVLSIFVWPRSSCTARRFPVRR